MERLENSNMKKFREINLCTIFDFIILEKYFVNLIYNIFGEKGDIMVMRIKNECIGIFGDIANVLAHPVKQKMSS